MKTHPALISPCRTKTEPKFHPFHQLLEYPMLFLILLICFIACLFILSMQPIAVVLFLALLAAYPVPFAFFLVVIGVIAAIQAYRRK